jgi:hypothetical protein
LSLSSVGLRRVGCPTSSLPRSSRLAGFVPAPSNVSRRLLGSSLHRRTRILLTVVPLDLTDVLASFQHDFVTAKIKSTDSEVACVARAAVDEKLLQLLFGRFSPPLE